MCSTSKVVSWLTRLIRVYITAGSASPRFVGMYSLARTPYSPEIPPFATVKPGEVRFVHRKVPFSQLIHEHFYYSGIQGGMYRYGSSFILPPSG